MSSQAEQQASFNPAQVRMQRQLDHNSPFISCRFDPSGRFVFAGAQDNSIQRWDLSNGQKTSFNGHQSWVRGMAFIARTNQLISGDYHGKLIWWAADAQEPRPQRTIDAHEGWLRAVAISPDGQTIATCGNDHLVKLWSVDNGRLIRELAGHDCHVYNIAFHPDGEALVSADLRGVIKQWNVRDGRQTRTFDAGMLHRHDTGFRAIIGGIRGMSFRGDGGQLACCGITDVTNAFAGVGKPLVVLFNWNDGQRTLLRPRENYQGTAWGVFFLPNGFIVAAGAGRAGRLWFWRPGEEQSTATVNVPSDARDLHIQPDGRRMAVACFDRKVRIYEAPAG